MKRVKINRFKVVGRLPRYAAHPLAPYRVSGRRWGSVALGIALAVVLLAGVVSIGSFFPNPQAFAQSQVMPSDDDVAKRLGIRAERVRQLRARLALNNQSLAQVPTRDVPRLMRRLLQTDLPRKREAFRALQDRDETGVIPPNALFNAARELQGLRSKIAGNMKIAGIPAGPDIPPMGLHPPTAGLAPGGAGWTSLGPGNIGGRIRSILVHPTTPSTIWVGSVGGGVWKTSNSGGSWAPVNDFMANLAVSCMLMNPVNANTMYAGTGEGFFNLDAIRGAGIFKTTNGGATWTQLPSTTGSNFREVNRLTISADGAVLLAATRKGIFRSADNGASWSLKSSVEMTDIDFHPTDKTKAIAGSGMSDGNAYFSINGGLTWTAATHPQPWGGRVEVTYARKDPLIVYASVDVNGGELWRSANGGKTYSLKNTGMSYLGQQGWYDNAVWAGDPANQNLVVIGGLDLWRSTNGGSSFTQISDWRLAPKSAHADHHVIVAHPKYNGTTQKTVFFGNDGGIYQADVKTVTPQVGWKELNNSLAITQFYGAGGNATSGTIVGGAQDNGTLRYTPAGGSENWTEMFGGDGGFSASDPLVQQHFYGEYVFLDIVRSKDSGVSAEEISGEFWNGMDWDWKPVPYQITDAMVCFTDPSNCAVNFIAPFILDPNNVNRMIAGGSSLWLTKDVKTANTNTTGPKWTAIKAPAGGGPISAIAMCKGCPLGSNLIWVGHNNGDIYRTNNSTALPVNLINWQKMDGGATPLPNRYCHRLTIDPADSKRVYATFGGYQSGNVWKTIDGGTTWKNIGATLPKAPVRSLVIHPSQPNLLYIGTEVGVFASENGGTTWSPTNEGPTNCSVDELFIMVKPPTMSKTLVAVTHGRGLFKIALP